MEKWTSDGFAEAADGYDRSKNPRMLKFRPMTVDEARALKRGSRPKFLARDGTLRDIKVNGAPKTWKRDLSRVEVPVKYGMYEYGTFRAQGGRMVSDSQNIFLVVVL